MTFKSKFYEIWRTCCPIDALAYPGTESCFIPSFLAKTALPFNDGDDAMLNCCDVDELFMVVLAKELSLLVGGSFRMVGCKAVVLKYVGCSLQMVLPVFKAPAVYRVGEYLSLSTL